MPLTRALSQYLLLSLVASGLCQTGHAEEFDADRAAAVKAGYLRYIAEYTKWPENEEPSDDIVIGLVGSDPNGVGALIRRTAGLTAQGRPLKVVDLELPTASGEGAIAPTQLSECDLVFLSEDGEARWPELEGLLGERAVVTVGEVAGFARQRGMIEFVVDRDAGRVRMHINIDALKRADLSLSARLLNLKEGVTIIRESDG